MTNSLDDDVLPYASQHWTASQKAVARILLRHALALIADRNIESATPTSLELERELLVALNYDAEE